MQARTYGRTDGRTDARMDAWMDAWTNRWIDSQTHECSDKRTNRLTDIWIGKAGKPTDRPIGLTMVVPVSRKTDE